MADSNVAKEMDKKDDFQYPSKEFNDKIAKNCQQLLVSSQIYKQPRMDVLAIYERIYNNDIPPKLRQMFNVALPIFSGMVDEMLAMFNDQVQIKFRATNPAEHLVVPKIQAHWDSERDSLAPNAKWNYKARTDRFNAVLSGRGLLKEYAYNDPEYTNVLEAIYYSDFHCEPNGGGDLENHLFQGTESNFKTLFELKNNDKYDKGQVDKLRKFDWSSQYFQELDTSYGTKFARWKALGLNIETNSFTGEPTFNLCDFVITHNGVRYNVVFEPCSGIWLYVKPWKEVYPSGMYPIKSWATHEDDQNFWSKSYADDFFPIADAVITLFNQELTNREKKNFNARAFDKDMFEDVGKLDAAQYRPDALVPANTMGGTKQIANGIYSFQTAELQGTINLIDWMSNYSGQKTGADELPPKGSNKVGVQILQQQKLSKRVGLRSDSFKECYSMLGTTFVEGMKEFMPPTLSVQVIGENGFIEEQELKRIDVRKTGLIGISVSSTSEQEGADALKKDAKLKAIEMVTQTKAPLSKYEKETIYRDIGGFDESEITLLLDEKNEISRKQIAHCSQAIQQILLNKVPDVYYGADIAYLNYYNQYIIDHKSQIKGKEKKFIEFLKVISPIVKQNMQQVAKNTPPQPPAGPDGKPLPPPAPGLPPPPQKIAPSNLSLPATANRVANVAQ